MTKTEIPAFWLLERVRKEKPLIHHLTNWVTIYDCANLVKVLGASVVMAHAQEEVAQMASLASALALNIGTLTPELVAAMKLAARAANKKGIPVVLDACGAGATRLRDKSCFELLEDCRIDIVKGNASEIARIAGERARTKGVDSGVIERDLKELAQSLAGARHCAVVITGKEDIVTDGKRTLSVKNGHPLMSEIVGTGCMATSAIATFAAVEKDLVKAAAAGLVCFEVAAECAAKNAAGPGSFKERLYDRIWGLDEKTINRMQKVYK
jgi:hydroxyethylthiazole kinase